MLLIAVSSAGLKFPLIMTACHMIFGSCALSPMMMMSEHYKSRHRFVLQNDWKGLSMIAVMNGFQIACNNASLTVMELSMNQVGSPFVGNLYLACQSIACPSPFPTLGICQGAAG